MSGAYPSPRSIKHAIDVVSRLPLEAIPDLVEALCERLDEADGDLDLEEESDMDVEDHVLGGVRVSDHGAGDADDAEVDDQDLDVEEEALVRHVLASSSPGEAYGPVFRMSAPAKPAAVTQGGVPISVHRLRRGVPDLTGRVQRLVR